MKQLTGLVIALLMAGTALASDVRVRTLGGNNQAVKDVYNTAIYPQLIVPYASYAWGTADPASLWKLGGTCQTPFGALGMNFTQGINGQLAFPFFPNVNTPGGPRSTIDQVFDLTVGIDADGTPVGLSVSLYSNFYEKRQNPDTNTVPPKIMDVTQNNAMGVAASLGVSFGANMDLAVFYDTYDWEDIDYQNAYYTAPRKNDTYGVHIRHTAQFTPEYTLIPYFSFRNSIRGRNFGVYHPLKGDYEEGTNQEFIFGASSNITVTEKSLLVFDIGIDFIEDVTEITSGTTDITTRTAFTDRAFPYMSIGFEGEVNDWVSVRFGAHKKWERFVDKDSASQSTTYGQVLTWTSVGGSLHHDRFRLDAELDPMFFMRGPNFVSGASGNLSTKVALVYYFGDQK